MAIKLPPGAWDSHIHVLETVSQAPLFAVPSLNSISLEPKRFPMRHDRPFTPKEANAEQAIAFERSLGIEHVCIIATSVYGQDNSALVDALASFGGKARGIAYIDPATISDAELDRLHAAGVRGVRLNLWTRGLVLSVGEWKDMLVKYATRLRRNDWVLQLFASMYQWVDVAPLLPGLGVRVVIDHLGCPNAGAAAAVDQPGAQALHTALQTSSRNVFIKISGAYRFEEVRGVDDHIQKLLRIAPSQVVWASDWPHTGGMANNPDRDPRREQEFLGPDIPGFLRRCLEFCGGREELVRAMWVDNARRLWDYEG